MDPRHFKFNLPPDPHACEFHKNLRISQGLLYRLSQLGTIPAKIILRLWISMGGLAVEAPVSTEALQRDIDAKKGLR